MSFVMFEMPHCSRHQAILSSIVCHSSVEKHTSSILH